MKVLFVNTSENLGGAAVAAGRLLHALDTYCPDRVDVRMLVRDKVTPCDKVLSVGERRKGQFYFYLERLQIGLNNGFDRSNLFTVSTASFGYDITRLREFAEADIIHLHWVNQGMISLEVLARILHSGKPVVWTMHDMWPCTGICHHARECENYRSECGKCMFLGSSSQHDLSCKVFRKKKKLYAGADITFVTCSRWLRDRAACSALVAGHEVLDIPNAIDTNVFRPCSKAEARARLGLPQDRKLILFGAVKTTDKRKGFDYMVEACSILADRHPDMVQNAGVIVVGKNSAAIGSCLPFGIYPFDYVGDSARMADIYNAADVFVTPSLEENLPNMIMEAMACGTPCVGFRVGGIPEMIEHGANGYLASYRSAEDFAAGIGAVLFSGRYEELSRNAVEKVASCYSESVVAGKYMDLYRKILTGKDKCNG